MFKSIYQKSETWLFTIIIFFIILFSVNSSNFFSLANFIDLLETYSVQAIMTMGLLVVLVSGGIDMSFVATASVSQYISALLASQFNLPIFWVISLGLLIGILLGFLNAILIYYVKIPSIIATISMMSISFALLMYFSNGRSIYDLPDWWINKIVFWEYETINGDLLRITLPIILMLITALITWILMNKLAIGRQIYAMGDNEESAHRIGINISKLYFFIYGYLGFLTALAGLLQAHRIGESVPNAMMNTELLVISAAVLGGASLNGGVGTVHGVLLGIILLAILQNGLNLLGISSYFFQIVIGIAILLSTSITAINSLRKNNKRANIMKENNNV